MTWTAWIKRTERTVSCTKHTLFPGTTLQSITNGKRAQGLPCKNSPSSSRTPAVQAPYFCAGPSDFMQAFPLHCTSQFSVLSTQRRPKIIRRVSCWLQLGVKVPGHEWLYKLRHIPSSVLSVLPIQAVHAVLRQQLPTDTMPAKSSEGYGS